MARTDILPLGSEVSLTLDRYQELMRLPEAAFNGLYRPSDADCYECPSIWKQTDRDALALANMQAEEMRYAELGYYLSPRYVQETLNCNNPFILNRKFYIQAGTRKSANISIGEVTGIVDPVVDPVVLVVATTVTDPTEIHVYYPGEDVEIHPKSITIAGGNATITIPLSRLVDPSVDTNCTPTPNYIDDTIYLDTVDVKRVYYDVADAISFVWLGCNSCGCDPEVGSSQYGYVCEVIDARTSILTVRPGTYDSGTGTWTRVPLTSCGGSCRLTINYLAGRRASAYTEIQTIRLGHTLLPSIVPDRMDLCSSCWKHDQEADPSNVRTPYGWMQGAVSVWMADSRAKVGQGGKFPRLR